MEEISFSSSFVTTEKNADLPIDDENTVTAKRRNNGPVQPGLHKYGVQHHATQAGEWWTGHNHVDMECGQQSPPPLFL